MCVRVCFLSRIVFNIMYTRDEVVFLYLLFNHTFNYAALARGGGMCYVRADAAAAVSVVVGVVVVVFGVAVVGWRLSCLPLHHHPVSLRVHCQTPMG